jgi:DNA-binding NarL/FixJ family response regulator
MRSTDQTRILIADDHPMFRTGLRQAIEADRSMVVVGEAGDGESALSLIEEFKPEVIILDVNMPGMSGFDVIAAVRRKALPGEIVLLTMHSEEAMFAKALSLGVRGYVLKDSAATDIIACLHAVRRGEMYTSSAVTTYLFKRASGNTKPVDGIGSLTPTERKVLRLIAEYKTSREIAAELGVSLRTIENHRNNAAAKLGIAGSHGLIKFALKHQSDI